MFEDQTVSNAEWAAASSTANSRGRADSAKPSHLEDEVVSLFDQLRDRLLRYLLSLGLPAPDGEEILQETFLALFRHLRSGKPRRNLRAWVFQVAHNLAMKQHNIARRNRQSFLEHASTFGDDSLVDQKPDPEARCSRNQRSVRLTGVWQALPEQDRRCLALRAEGLTYREVAQVLDMSLGAVSASLARSLARFARADGR